MISMSGLLANFPIMCIPFKQFGIKAFIEVSSPALWEEPKINPEYHMHQNYLNIFKP